MQTSTAFLVFSSMLCFVALHLAFVEAAPAEVTMGSCSGCIANLEDLSKVEESELKVNVKDGTYQLLGNS
ncbi:hypothetical protein QOT17_021387 [Balamuthia mandrillaris]